MPPLEIVGRRSSLFTRMALIVAQALDVPYRFVPIYDMTEQAQDVYGGNPALKLPTLKRNGVALFGTLNICRAIAESGSRVEAVVWPEQLRDDRSRNAQELVWHCMSAQVQILMGTLVGKLPADNVYFAKARTGLVNSLAWLDDNLAGTLELLPAQRVLSIYEVSLFCLLEHLAWRMTIDTAPYERLLGFVDAYGKMPAAEHTQYEFDKPPSG